MSKFPNLLCVLVLCVLVPAGTMAAPAVAAQFNLGRAPSQHEIAAWDTDIRPDGLGLPEGGGSVLDGEEIFADQCAACHGDFGEGVDRWPVLSGGIGTLSDDRPEKTMGSYWPFLSTAFDYIQRSMPFGDARSLEADETYAIVAYLLYMNDIVDDEEFVLSKENFLSIEMPNSNGFVDDPRPDMKVLTVGEKLCMVACKPAAVITGTASVLDVTPDDENNP